MEKTKLPPCSLLLLRDVPTGHLVLMGLQVKFMSEPDEDADVDRYPEALESPQTLGLKP